MISGIMMAITASDKSTSYNTGYNTVAAATRPTDVYTYPVKTANPVLYDTKLDIPDDLLRDIASQKGFVDTVYVTNTDTIIKQVTKVKWRQAPVPDPIVQTDTIQVPVYYLAPQVGNKEGPTEQCISVYEVHKVDEICPEPTNASMEPVNELDIGDE